MLPADPARARAIFTSYQGLLLETAQAVDEADAKAASQSGQSESNGAVKASSLLAELSRFHGVEFVLQVASEDKAQFASWGLDNAEQLAAWTQSIMEGFRSLGETLQAGTLNRLDGRGAIQNVAIASRGEKELCVGFHRSLTLDTVRDTTQKILSKWVS